MSVSLTPEQQRRIEENRQRALARRAEKQAQLTPGSAQNKPQPPSAESAKNSQLSASDRAHPGAPAQGARQVGTQALSELRNYSETVGFRV